MKDFLMGVHKDKIDRRVNKQLNDSDLYKNTKSLILKERRKAELKRLKEINEEAEIYNKTLLVCFLFFVALIALAVKGSI